MAQQAAAERLTHQQIADKVGQHRGKRSTKHRGVKLTFPVDGGWKIVVSRATRGTYHEVEQALNEVLEEVQIGIRGGVQIL